MHLYLIVKSGLMEKPFVAAGRKVPVFLVLFAITCFASICYANKASHLATAPALTSQEVSYINSVPINSTKIPAWLIAQLLGPSARLRPFATSQPAGPPVNLNDLLAIPDRYRSQVVAVKAEFIEASEVTEELQLLPPDRCWSAILLDATYHQPIQLFTPEDPSGFIKHSDVCIFGYYLTNRTDQPKSAFSSQPLIIPVFSGIIIKEDNQSISGNAVPQGNYLVKVFPLLAAIVLLLIAFFALRHYISRQDKKQGDFHLPGFKTTTRTEKWKK
jgi:hypothetical protein